MSWGDGVVDRRGTPPIRLRCWSNLGWKLPWEIESSGRVWSSLRPEISRAVLALIDPDSPNRAELDGASYWIEEFWDDFGDFYDLYDRRSAVSASQKYDPVAGYSDIAPWFHVDS